MSGGIDDAVELHEQRILTGWVLCFVPGQLPIQQHAAPSCGEHRDFVLGEQQQRTDRPLVRRVQVSG
jgi:hypothetical protein